LKGLEVSIVPLSEVQASNTKLRIDSLYFSKEAVTVQKLVEGMEHVRFADCTKLFAKGIFDIKSDTYVEDGIPFIRISDLRGGVVSDDRCAFIDDFSHAKEFKTALFRGDFVLSKTAYPAAAYIAVEECNVSQDVIAVRFKDEWKARIPSAYVTAFFNGRYGNVLLKRQFQGNVQEHLSLEDGKSVPIPLFSEIFAQKANAAFESAQEERNRAIDVLRGAEQTLLHALGLENWSPPEPLSYTRKASEVWEAARLDSQFHAPRVQQLMRRLGADNQTIKDVAPARRDRFSPGLTGEFDYIEISNVQSDGTVTSERILQSDAPSRATSFVRVGDVITSTVRPIRQLTARIQAEQSGAVCSSGFVVLQPQAISTELLMTYLRLPLVCELMDLHCSASLYPAISEADILALPIPKVSADVEEAVKSAVLASQQARHRAVELLERAKRAVEIAIEQSEAAALAYLEG
jgi:type I restriction enzyme, S subunit